MISPLSSHSNGLWDNFYLYLLFWVPPSSSVTVNHLSLQTSVSRTDSRASSHQWRTLPLAQSLLQDRVGEYGTFLLLWKYILTKTTYARRVYIGVGFQTNVVHPGRENTVAGREGMVGGARDWLVTLHLPLESWTGRGTSYRVSRAIPSDTLPPEKLHLLRVPQPSPTVPPSGAQVSKGYRSLRWCGAAHGW